MNPGTRVRSTTLHTSPITGTVVRASKTPGCLVVKWDKAESWKPRQPFMNVHRSSLDPLCCCSHCTLEKS